MGEIKTLTYSDVFRRHPGEYEIEIMEDYATYFSEIVDYIDNMKNKQERIRAKERLVNSLLEDMEHIKGIEGK